MLNAAIIGLGRWGQALVNSVHNKSDEIRFVAGYTRTRTAAEEFCRDKDIRLADGFDRILADPSIEAVVIATPHSQHETQVTQAARAGKHVFVEKPITLSRASADKAVAAAKDAGVVLAVAFPRRFNPSIAEVRRRLKEGQFGDLIAMVGQQTSGAAHYMARDNWRADPHESPVGSITAVGVHLLDNMIEFGGRIREVYCVAGDGGGYGYDDTTTSVLNFERGAVGTIFGTTSAAPNFNFAIYGTKGIAEISKQQLQNFRFAAVPEKAPPIGPLSAPPAEVIEHSGFDMLNAELTQFARSVRTSEPFPVKIDEVLHGMSVLDALAESARTRRPVSVVDA